MDIQNVYILPGLNPKDLNYLCKIVCQEFNVLEKDFKSKSKKGELPNARCVFSKVTSQNYTRREIASFLNRSTSAITIQIQTLDKYMTFEKKLKESYLHVKEKYDLFIEL